MAYSDVSVSAAELVVLATSSWFVLSPDSKVVMSSFSGKPLTKEQVLDFIAADKKNSPRKIPDSVFVGQVDPSWLMGSAMVGLPFSKYKHRSSVCGDGEMDAEDKRFNEAADMAGIGSKAELEERLTGKRIVMLRRGVPGGDCSDGDESEDEESDEEMSDTMAAVLGAGSPLPLGCVLVCDPEIIDALKF